MWLKSMLAGIVSWYLSHMIFSTNIRNFWISLLVLVVLHTVVTFVAYRVFTTRTTESVAESPPVETSTPEQRASGGMTITMVRTETIRVAVPTPVWYYILFGYAGLGVSAVMGLYTWLRTY